MSKQESECIVGLLGAADDSLGTLHNDVCFLTAICGIAQLTGKLAFQEFFIN